MIILAARGTGSGASPRGPATARFPPGAGGWAVARFPAPPARFGAAADVIRTGPVPVEPSLTVPPLVAPLFMALPVTALPVTAWPSAVDAAGLVPCCPGTASGPVPRPAGVMAGPLSGPAGEPGRAGLPAALIRTE